MYSSGACPATRDKEAHAPNNAYSLFYSSDFPMNMFSLNAPVMHPKRPEFGALTAAIGETTTNAVAMGARSWRQ